MASKAAAEKASPKTSSNNKSVAQSKAATKAAVIVKPIAVPTPKGRPIVTSKHLAASIADQLQIPQKQAGLLLVGLVELMVDHLKKGDRLKIGGLGVLEVKSRPARMGRNPATGEAIQVKASKKIVFRAAKDLKEAI